MILTMRHLTILPVLTTTKYDGPVVLRPGLGKHLEQESSQDRRSLEGKVQWLVVGLGQSQTLHSTARR